MMGWHIGSGLVEFISTGLALLMLIAGWQLFRGAVALAMGALCGGVSFAVVAGLLLKNDAGFSAAMQSGALAGVLGLFVGLLIGLRAQQLCAAVGTFVMGGAFATALFWILSQSQSHSNDSAQGALVLGAFVGLVMALLVNRFYDVMAAAIMAAFVARGFIPGSPGFLDAVLLGEGAPRGFFDVVLDALRWLSRSIWAAIVVPAWIIGSAAILRMVAWTPRTVEREPALIPAWRGAIVGASLLVLAAYTSFATWRLAELMGVYSVVWPALVFAVYRTHTKLRARTEPSALGRYGAHLALVLAGVPLLDAAMLVVVRDLPALFTDAHGIASLRYLIEYYGGFLSPGFAASDDVDTAAGVIFALALKWTLNLVAAPALLEAGFTVGAPAEQPAPPSTARPRALTALALSLASAFVVVAAWNVRMLHRQPELMARGLLRERAPRGLCTIPLTAAPATANASEATLMALSHADLMRLLFPSYVPGWNHVAVSQHLDGSGATRFETSACGGVTVVSNPRGGIGNPDRVALGGGRVLLRVVTLSEQAGGADELSGVLAVLAVRDRTAVVDTLGTWSGQLERLTAARVEPLAGEVAYIVPSVEADGNDGSSRGEQVWLDRDGHLALVGGYTVSSGVSGPMSNLPWDQGDTATPEFVDGVVKLHEVLTFEPSGQSRAYGFNVASARRVLTRTYALRDGHLVEQGSVRMLTPPVPREWVEMVRRESGDENADEVANGAEAVGSSTPAPRVAAQGGPPSVPAVPPSAQALPPSAQTTPPTTQPPVSLVAVRPTTVTASSWFHSHHHEFSPWLAFDGDLHTAWNDGVEGSPVGQWIEARFDRPRHLRRVTFSTGWDTTSRRGDDLFMGNAHLRIATLTVDGATAATVEASYDERSKTVSLDVTGSSLRITATQVHNGTRWQDVCVSEVTIEAEP